MASAGKQRSIEGCSKNVHWESALDNQDPHDAAKILHLIGINFKQNAFWVAWTERHFTKIGAQHIKGDPTLEGLLFSRICKLSAYFFGTKDPYAIDDTFLLSAATLLAPIEERLERAIKCGLEIVVEQLIQDIEQYGWSYAVEDFKSFYNRISYKYNFYCEYAEQVFEKLHAENLLQDTSSDRDGNWD